MKLEPNMLRLPAIGLNFDCISKRKGLKKQLNYIWVSILQVKSGYTPSSKYKWKYDIQELNIWGEWRSGVEEVGCWSYGVEEEGGGRGGSSGSDCPAYPHTGVLYGQLLILTHRGSLHRRRVVHSQLDSDALTSQKEFWLKVVNKSYHTLDSATPPSCIFWKKKERRKREESAVV